MAAIFALTPGSHNTEILNYATIDDRKLYEKGSRSLNGDERYDLGTAGLFTFLKSLGNRADEYGWSKKASGILSIPMDPPNVHPAGEELYYLEHYGTITPEQLLAAEEMYVFGQERAAQDNVMLFNALMGSLTETARNTITLFEDEYIVRENPGLHNEETRKSGVLLLHVIIRESHIDTNATTSTLRRNLAQLPDYMVSIESDIGVFNQYVRLQVQSLAARQETSNDLLVNLFSGYLAASDQTFRDYIKRKKEEYDKSRGAVISAESLMQLAKNKYDTL